MTDLVLDIGATFRARLELPGVAIPGREYRMHIREMPDSPGYVMSLTSPGGISATQLQPTVYALDLYAGASVTELLLVSDPVRAACVYDVESYDPNDPDDVERVAAGVVYVSQNVTRNTAPAAQAVGLLSYSEPQVLTSAQQAQAQANLGVTGAAASGVAPVTISFGDVSQRTIVTITQPLTLHAVRLVLQAYDGAPSLQIIRKRLVQPSGPAPAFFQSVVIAEFARALLETGEHEYSAIVQLLPADTLETNYISAGATQGAAELFFLTT